MFDDPKIKGFMIHVVRRCLLIFVKWIEDEYDLQKKKASVKCPHCNEYLSVKMSDTY
jgi:hypothetical protein